MTAVGLLVENKNKKIQSLNYHGKDTAIKECNLSEVFCKKDVLRHFAKFTGNHLSFLIILQIWGL